MPATRATWGERVVGGALIALGLWGLRQSMRVRAAEHRHGAAHSPLAYRVRWAEGVGSVIVMVAVGSGAPSEVDRQIRRLEADADRNPTKDVRLAFLRGWE